MTDGTPMQPRRPTPITVAAVLLDVAGGGCLLACGIYAYGVEFRPSPTWIGMFFASWFLAKFGSQLLNGEVGWVGTRSATLGVLVTLPVYVVVPLLVRAIGEVGLTHRFEDYCVCGGLSMWLSCSLAVYVACFLLIRYSLDYDEWRETHTAVENAPKRGVEEESSEMGEPQTLKNLS